ncbi:MAG: hypothetical protein ACFBSC_15680 [Microcoleaceae cyanobacterium]
MQAQLRESHNQFEAQLQTQKNQSLNPSQSEHIKALARILAETLETSEN